MRGWQAAEVKWTEPPSLLFEPNGEHKAKSELLVGKRETVVDAADLKLFHFQLGKWPGPNFPTTDDFGL